MHYLTYAGPINLSEKTLDGFKFPDDVWARSLRLYSRGFVKCRYEYLADWFWFNRDLGRI